jgi:hypothetical protein
LLIGYLADEQCSRTQYSLPIEIDAVKSVLLAPAHNAGSKLLPARVVFGKWSKRQIDIPAPDGDADLDSLSLKGLDLIFSPAACGAFGPLRGSIGQSDVDKSFW